MTNTTIKQDALLPKDIGSSLKSHIFLIVLLSFSVYWNTLNNSFQIDDHYVVVNNPGTEKVWPISRHFFDPSTASTIPRIAGYRPLLPLSLSINYAINGYSLSGYHLFNIGLHTLSAIMVYLLCAELLRQTSPWKDQKLRSRWLAFMVAVVFVVHPVSGYSVNYISGRGLLMMELFLLSSFLLYIRMCRVGDAWPQWVAVLLLLLLSLLSKENSVVMPGLVFAYELIVRQRSVLDRMIWLRTLPFIVIVLGFLSFIHYGIGSSLLGKSLTTIDLQEHWAFAITQLKLHFTHYGLNFIWPLNIMEGHYIKPATLMEPGPWLGLVLVLSTLYVAWRVRQSNPLISLSILAYWMFFVPASSVIPMPNRWVADYRPYASSIFLYFALGIIAFTSLKRRTLVGISFILVVYLSGVAVYQNTTWKTGASFWERAVETGEASTLAYLNYAMQIDDMNLREKYLRKALERNPHYILAKINLGLTLIHKGQKEEGLDLLKGAVRQDPAIAQSQYWLAVAYELTGKMREGAEAASRAANLHPLPLYQYKAGLLMQNIGRHEDSIPLLEAVMEYDSDYLRTGFLLGFAYQKMGRLETIKTYQDYLDRKPLDSQAQFNLAYALMKKEKYQIAIQHFNEALQLRKEYHEVHLHLATCYRSLGRAKEAEKHLAKWNKKR
jgi:protein O-mannosyl-transferase